MPVRPVEVRGHVCEELREDPSLVWALRVRDEGDSGAGGFDAVPYVGVDGGGTGGRGGGGEERVRFGGEGVGPAEGVDVAFSFCDGTPGLFKALAWNK